MTIGEDDAEKQTTEGREYKERRRGAREGGWIEGERGGSKMTGVTETRTVDACETGRSVLQTHLPVTFDWLAGR